MTLKNKIIVTENISKELETRLKDFFTDVIDAKDMAKTIREVNYVLSLCSMRGCETIESEFKNIDDNFYWLNRLAEVLDPYLEID
ncbi:hypothetical protein [Flavobacterium endoglycinae]|uniref:hypothetical protein n=1 Tax=Flavobacterium endoglycinae TaxID=2816357 RepID=UPI0037429FE7